jgi:hypothetical protein
VVSVLKSFWFMAALSCAVLPLCPGTAHQAEDGKGLAGLASPYQLLPPLTDTSGYLTGLRLLRLRQEAYLRSPQWRGSFLELIATLTSFVGNDREAIGYFDEREPPQSDTPAAAHSPLAGYSSRDARKAILQVAPRHEVIMINEAHHIPLHRAFTLSLLRGLRRRGFRYFAAETLTASDRELMQRGYPTLSTGYYTHEPLHGELVREALRLGYQVVPYEAEGAASPFASGDPAAAMNERERIQAENLRDRILKKDPAARIVIHAGYGHIIKRSTTIDLGDQKPELLVMAVRFKALTGIDPLTIDQVEMTEHSTPRFEDPVYRFAADGGMLDPGPRVFQNRAGGFYVPEGAKGNYDVVVFHPRTRYQAGRPTWRCLGGARRPFFVHDVVRPAEGDSCLVQAFYAAEDPRVAVPLDQTELRASGPPPALMLPRHGRFLIREVDASGKVLHERLIRRE